MRFRKKKRYVEPYTDEWYADRFVFLMVLGMIAVLGVAAYYLLPRMIHSFSSPNP